MNTLDRIEKIYALPCIRGIYRDTLVFILLNEGKPLSRVDMQKKAGIPSNTSTNHITRLKELGYIKWIRQSANGKNIYTVLV